jgi:hypothetical protein
MRPTSEAIITYTPSRDEMLLRLRATDFGPSLRGRGFRIWLDQRGNLCSFALTSFEQRLTEFRKTLHSTRLGGIWRDLRLTEKDIREARAELLQKLEDI